MIKVLVLSLLTACSLNLSAQQESKPFKGYFWNEEYKVYLKINLHDSDISVPSHELFGTLPGYLGKQYNNFFWLITDSKVNKQKATISLINDFGSEDLKATLSLKGDSIIIFKQGNGSTLKVPYKGKWQKLPSQLEFKRK